MIVPDASAIVEWLLQSERGARVAKVLFSGTHALHSPHLLEVEVMQGLRRCEAAGLIRPSRTQEAIQDFLDLPIKRHPHEPLLWRIWDLHGNLVAYDAAYVALAETLGATVLTCDVKMGRASGHYARIELV